MGYFSGREMVENLLCLRQQFLNVKMREDKRLEMDVKMFVGRKNEVVGELNQALEILTAAFGVELKPVLMYKMGFMFVFMAMAMRTRLGRINETAGQMMVFGAIVELYVPTHRDEQHHKGHHQGTDLQDSFFHAAKIGKIILWKASLFLMKNSGFTHK